MTTSRRLAVTAAIGFVLVGAGACGIWGEDDPDGTTGSTGTTSPSWCSTTWRTAWCSTAGQIATPPRAVTAPATAMLSLSVPHPVKTTS